MRLRAKWIGLVSLLAVLLTLVSVDLPRSGRAESRAQQTSAEPPVPRGTAVAAERVSKPLKPAKAMTRSQRQTQVGQAQLLGVFPPKVRQSKSFAAASVKAVRAGKPRQTVVRPGEKQAGQGPSARPGGEGDPARRQAPPSVEVAAADPYEGARWGDTYIGQDEADLDPSGVKTKLTAKTPIKPQTYFVAQPGRTSLNFAVEWTGASTDRPWYMRLQLYRASDNKLMATRLVSRDTTTSQGDTVGACTWWVAGTGSDVPKNCSFGVTDGVLDGQTGVEFYAKISFGAEQTNHWYKFPDVDKKYREYWLPTAWTSSLTTPKGTAWLTPGIPGGMGGNCTCSYQFYRADPVNTATGVVRETITDAVVPGKGLPLNLTRHYASDAKETTGLLGKGWRLPYEAKLSPAADSATLTDADGATVKFTKKSDGTYTAPKPVRFTLTSTADGFTLTALDHTRRLFDKAGRLTGWVDGSGKGLTLGYTDGRLAKITDAAGRDTAFEVDAASGRLSSVTLPGGRKVLYHQTEGQLEKVTGPEGGETKYTYQGGKLATVVDPNGKTVTQNTYDADSGRINRQVDANGGTHSFKWRPKAGSPAGSGESEMTDPAGGIWTDVYEAGVLRRSYAPEGGGTDRSFDRHLNVTESYDSKYQPTNVTYDDHGNIATATKGGITQKTGFDAAGRLESTTNGRGLQTIFKYEGDSNRIKSFSGPAGTAGYTYNADGLTETQTSPSGGTTRYGYDRHGQLSSVTKPEGGRTTYTYTADGQIKTETEPRGNVEGADPDQYTTVYDYLPNGRLRSVTDPKSRSTSFTYDSNGNTETVTDAKDRVTRYKYNAANQVESVINPAGKQAFTHYDTRGNVEWQVDETGRKTTYKYDGAGRLSASTSPRGNELGADPVKFTTTYGYDRNGNQDEVVDPTGGLTTTEYDDLDRPDKVTDPMNRTTVTKYDDNGNVKEVTNARNVTTSYTYTDADQLRTVTNPLLKTTTYGYDADGNQSSSETHLGRKTTWKFDGDGRLIAQTDPRGYLTDAKPEDYTTEYRYDEAGNRTKAIDPLGNTETTEYNTLGQVAARIDAKQKRTDYGYNEVGQLDTVTAADDGVTKYGYDSVGNLETREDDNKNTTTYGYDDAHRLTSVTDPLQRSVTHKYDPDGNLYLTTNARGTTTTTTFNTND
ncbi:DUF6531 domain-containing protein [Streptomyces sp. NPDC059900]|uniref:DUF6531 domain-containing protein n=1 Tax=Streptomyces sp. NPDC059900 TaxID=3155816 RepID=UPI003D04EF11